MRVWYRSTPQGPTAQTSKPQIILPVPEPICVCPVWHRQDVKTWHSALRLVLADALRMAPQRQTECVCLPMNTHRNPWGRLKWPSAITRSRTVHSTWMGWFWSAAGVLRPKSRGMFFLTLNVFIETKFHETFTQLLSCPPSCNWYMLEQKNVFTVVWLTLDIHFWLGHSIDKLLAIQNIQHWLIH